MSIATLTRRPQAPARYATSVQASRPAPTRSEQLRDTRALLRHLMLAGTAAAAALYTATSIGF